MMSNIVSCFSFSTMMITVAYLKANFSYEWKIFKVIARTLAIIIIEPRENVFYCDFIPDKPSPALFLFFSRTAYTSIFLFFLLDTRVIVYIYEKNLYASHYIFVFVVKRKGKSIFDEQKKEEEEEKY